MNYDVVIAGGGPAGASAATHLAMRGARVLLAEQKKFPRAKLCGEFISPECLTHFRKLGVFQHMMAARGAELAETVFYARSGNRVSVPSAWFGGNGIALGLSRSAMDEILLRRASEAGVTVLEQTRAVGLVTKDGRVTGVSFRSTERQTGQSTEDDRATCRTQDGNEFSCTATVTIDATGREHALLRGLRVRINSSSPTKRRASLVAFKAYFEGARPASGACEIYFYRGGYGGLSSVEGGLSNLCFIASARDVRRCRADPERVMREVVCRNRRASYSLATARACSDWFAVSLNGFGRRSLAPAPGLITIGDAASFIDPFTGSGMLMALESGELVAEVVNGYSTRLNQFGDFEGLAQAYRHLYRQRFNARLRVCSMLRRAAFVPGLAAAAIRVAGASGHLRRGLARATRSAD